MFQSILFFVSLYILQIFSHENLCNYVAQNKYSQYINQFPNHKDMFNLLSKIPLPVWYTDRDPSALENVKNLINNCGDLTSVVIIYALPNKDCVAGFSTSGSVTSLDSYKKYIQDLQNVVNQKKIIYILEPDAIALSVETCGKNNNYISNMKEALKILKQNNNAEIYVDVGYWLLVYGEDKVREVVSIINQLDSENRLKGIILNLSNYRSNDELINACNRFKSISGKNYNCIIDTSRNGNGPSSINQWCNYKNAALGILPQAHPTSNIDYYLWLKPASELDGSCLGFDDSYQVNKQAGEFDLDYLVSLYKKSSLNNMQC
jgi:cellulase/cellobiase CelA1